VSIVIRFEQRADMRAGIGHQFKTRGLDRHESALHPGADHIFVRHRHIVRQTLISSDFGGERLGVQRLAGGMFSQTVPVE
jgi:hypothetical protein